MHLDDISGDVIMTDKTEVRNKFQQTPYELNTSKITNVIKLIYGTVTDGPLNTDSGGYPWTNAFNGSFAQPGANGKGSVGSNDYYMCNVQDLKIKAGDFVEFLCNMVMQEFQQLLMVDLERWDIICRSRSV